MAALNSREALQGLTRPEYYKAAEFIAWNIQENSYLHKWWERLYLGAEVNYGLTRTPWGKAMYVASNILLPDPPRFPTEMITDALDFWGSPDARDILTQYPNVFSPEARLTLESLRWQQKAQQRLAESFVRNSSPSEVRRVERGISALSQKLVSDPSADSIWNGVISVTQPEKSSSFEEFLKKYKWSPEHYQDIFDSATFAFVRLAQISHSKKVANIARGFAAASTAMDLAKGIDVTASILSLGSIPLAIPSALTVVGIGATIIGLFQENGENQALGQIYSLIDQMHRENLEHFEQIEEGLRTVSGQLSQMQQNAVAMFSELMQQGSFHYNELREQLRSDSAMVVSQLDRFRMMLSSFGHLILDGDIQRVALKMRLESDERIIAQLPEYISLFADWLTRVATDAGSTGHVPRRFQRLSIDGQVLTRELQDIFAPESEKNSNLGLLASILKDMMPNHTFPKLVQPDKWLVVARIYLGILSLGSTSLRGSTPQIRRAYREQIEEVMARAQAVIDFYSHLQNPEIWRSLVAGYQHHFDLLSNRLTSNASMMAFRDTIENKTVPLLSLRETVIENAERLQSQLSPFRPDWVGLSGERSDDLVEEKLIHTAGRGLRRDGIPPRNFSFHLTEKQFEVFTHQDPTDTLGRVFREITARSPVLKLYEAYDVIRRAIAYFPLVVGREEYTWDYTVYVLPGVKIDGRIFPLVQGNLWETEHRNNGGAGFAWHALELYHGFNSTYRVVTYIKPYTFLSSFPGAWAETYFYRRNETELVLKELETGSILERKLSEFRGALVKDYHSLEARSNLTQDVLLGYARLMGFVTLANPEFSPPEKPAILSRLFFQIASLAQNGTAENLNGLIAILHESAWGEHLETTDIGEFIQHRQEDLRNHPVPRAMTELQRELAAIRDQLVDGPVSVISPDRGEVWSCDPYEGALVCRSGDHPGKVRVVHWLSPLDIGKFEDGKYGCSDQGDVRYCRGDRTEYVQYTEPTLWTSLSGAAIQGAAYSAVSEAAGDMMRYYGYSENTIRRVHMAGSIAMGLATGSLIGTVLGTATGYVLRRAGYPKTALVASQGVATLTSAGSSPIALVLAGANVAGSTVGIAAEKGAVQVMKRCLHGIQHFWNRKA
ncbi:MAG: hypothetical protein A3F09_01000 [Chlamydiae bacterium RIFCSPHIGHO2_12_FULL_49_11]|nr:MAG: hypothetical protein A3F09_01000 [Chlamydiae bacterium RIFCSPHIGHO2_12_FULL_49_11]